MGRRHVTAARAAAGVSQETLDVSDIVGRWKWDIVRERVYADPAVVLLFNVEPEIAPAGASLNRSLEAVHPEDRERTHHGLAASIVGLPHLPAGVPREVGGWRHAPHPRARTERDAAGRPRWGRVLLIDVTQDRLDAACVVCSEPHQHPLLLAAEHCLAMRRALHEPLLSRMSDMLLLEIGRAMVRAESAEPRSRMN